MNGYVSRFVEISALDCWRCALGKEGHKRERRRKWLQGEMGFDYVLRTVFTFQEAFAIKERVARNAESAFVQQLVQKVNGDSYWSLREMFLDGLF